MHIYKTDKTSATDFRKSVKTNATIDSYFSIKVIRNSSVISTSSPLKSMGKN